LIHGLGRGKKSGVQKMSFVGVLDLSGAVCLISLRKEMGFALIMVGLIAEINMPMVWSCFFCMNSLMVTVMESYTVLTFIFLHFGCEM